MAIISPTTFSAELQLVPPQTQAYTPVPTGVHYGRVRRSHFTIHLEGDEPQDTTIIAACLLPRNARIGKSDIFISDGPGASVTFDIGLAARDGSGVLDANTTLEQESTAYDGLPAPSSLADSGTYLGSFAPADSAAAGTFADTIAHHVGAFLRKDAYLIITVQGADVDTECTLFGYVDYVVD